MTNDQLLLYVCVRGAKVTRDVKNLLERMDQSVLGVKEALVSND